MRWTMLWIAVSLAAVWVPGCGDTSGDGAHDILSRTVPPGAPIPSTSDPARSPASLQLTWDVEAQMSPTGYVDWLKARLREFQVVQDSGLELHLTKLAAGDAYRLHVTLVPGTGITHVHLQLTATPD